MYICVYMRMCLEHVVENSVDIEHPQLHWCNMCGNTWSNHCLYMIAYFTFHVNPPDQRFKQDACQSGGICWCGLATRRGTIGSTGLDGRGKMHEGNGICWCDLSLNRRQRWFHTLFLCFEASNGGVACGPSISRVQQHLLGLHVVRLAGNLTLFGDPRIKIFPRACFWRASLKPAGRLGVVSPCERSEN